ncbi:12015_t:CDS:2 [Cetraspora pellucida]|uniref:12015_t:CDS:1 n=1 Tax=Cetraspora pellucida TaxID=1433469 RepID=A0ACA9KZZ5_9GLOM|nr:12015_t:CDS:2 [Cetraspora pellucida]
MKCEDNNVRPAFSWSLDSEECDDNIVSAFSWHLEFSDSISLSLVVSEDICEPLSLELEIVKDNSCMSLKVSEDNIRSTFDLGLELESNVNLEVSKNISEPSFSFELAKSKTSVVSDIGLGSMCSLSFKKDNTTKLSIGLQFDF